MPKELRTSFVSMMSYQGVPVEEIARLAGQSADGANAWQPVPFSSPGPGTTVTALTASADGFTVAGQFGAAAGDLNAAVWTSADGTSWAQAPVIGLTGGGSQLRPHGRYRHQGRANRPPASGRPCRQRLATGLKVCRGNSIATRG